MNSPLSYFIGGRYTDSRIGKLIRDGNWKDEANKRLRGKQGIVMKSCGTGVAPTSFKCTYAALVCHQNQESKI